VQDALPSREEMDKIARDTDPEEFLSELRLVSENMAALEAHQKLLPGATNAPWQGEVAPGVSFAKKGFLNQVEAAAPPPAHTSAPEPAGLRAGPVLAHELAEVQGGAALELVVHVPDSVDRSELEVDISAELVHIHGPGGLGLRLQLPRPVREEAASAKFIKKKRQLRLTMPVATGAGR